MTTRKEFEEEFEGHAVHMSHRQDTDDIVTCFQVFAHHMLRKIDVAPQRTVRNHHTVGGWFYPDYGYYS